MFARLWRDPVWATVIATVIVAAFGALWTTLTNNWSKVGSALTTFVGWFAAKTPVSNWLLVLLIVCAAAVVFVVGLVLWERFGTKREDSSQAAGWRSYTSDELFGLRWRWRLGDDAYIHDLHAFCLKCDYQVFPAERSGLNGWSTTYSCEDCGHTPPAIQGAH